MRKLAFLVAAMAVSSLLLAGPAGAGAGCHDGALTDERTTTVQMSGMCFRPTVVRVDRGDTVTWKNVDGMDHMLGGVAGSFGEIYTELPAGKSISYTFEEDGVYPYVCILHAGMAGAVVVGDGSGNAAAGSVTGGTLDDAPAANSAETATDASGTPAWAVPAMVAAAAAALYAGTTALRRRRTVAASVRNA